MIRRRDGRSILRWGRAMRIKLRGDVHRALRGVLEAGDGGGCSRVGVRSGGIQGGGGAYVVHAEAGGGGADWGVCEGGAEFVATYLSGIANESDLCFLGGFPGPLREALEIWAEEMDVLHKHNEQTVEPVAGNGVGLRRSYKARDYCDVIHAEGADVLATYGSDFYAGEPAVTVNKYGKGLAYYVASRNEEGFTQDFLGAVAEECGVKRAIDGELPEGVSAQCRQGENGEFLFLLNYNAGGKEVELGGADIGMW